MCMTTIPTKAVGMYDEKALGRMAAELFPQILRVGCAAFGNEDPEWFGKCCAVLHVEPAMYGVDVGELRFVKLVGDAGQNCTERARHVGEAYEMASRLASQMDRSVIASYETRDPEQGQHGGAVVLPLLGTETILALSGLSEYAGEAFCLLLGRQYDPCDSVRARCEQVAQRTGNPYYAALAREILDEPMQ